MFREPPTGTAARTGVQTAFEDDRRWDRLVWGFTKIVYEQMAGDGTAATLL